MVFCELLELMLLMFVHFSSIRLKRANDKQTLPFGFIPRRTSANELNSILIIISKRGWNSKSIRCMNDRFEMN